MNSLKLKFYITFSLLTISSVSILFIAHFYISKTNRFEKFEDAISNTYTNLLLKNNWIQYLSQEELKRKNDKLQAEEYNYMYEQIDFLNEKIQQEISNPAYIPTIKDLHLTEEHSQISKTFQSQQNLNDKLLRLFQLRGSADRGIIGEVRKQSHNLEATLPDKLELILSMRRNEKDYLLRSENKYINNVFAIAKLLKIEISNSDDINKNVNQTYLHNYLRNFSSLVAINNKIGLNKNEGLNLEISKTNAKIQHIIGKFKVNLRDTIDSETDNLKLILYVFSISLIIFSLLISIYLSNKISKPILLLARQTKNFVLRKFEVKHVDPIQTNDTELKNLIENYYILENEIFELVTDFKEKVEQRTTTINAQNKELIALNSTKDKFFSIIAHDLKGPFSTIYGFSSKLLENFEKYDEKKQKRYINNISVISYQTSKLLENLLEWARLQQGHLKIKSKQENLNSIITEVLSISSEIARYKLIKINYKTNNLEVKCDKESTKTIIRNIISNAIKFTNPKGSISITSEKTDKEVIVQIKDNGIGISENNIQKIFKIEENITTKGTENEQGTGLGLLLCKELVEKQGGKIWLTSEINEGTSVHFTIPII